MTIEEGADPRRAELAQRLSDVRGRIAAACVEAGRDPAEVTLIAVTKTYPAADVRRLVELGVHDIGENKDQEAAPKAAELAAAGAAVRWHFVGQLQRNKAKSVVRYADLLHSVDSSTLVAALDRAATVHRERPLDVLVQVSLDADLERGGAAIGAGVPERDLERVVAAVAESESLRLRGVMAVAPLAWDPRSAFDRLAEVASVIRRDHPDSTVVSAGMSVDLEAAISAGATHVRIGAALLGKRAALR
ncbi:YggS family pyridoxal phosphate-dependent enzyme [Planosporangium flavigriseum]|uniref:Pyridoxal phosphate homeostasis protein n=1 Tax=Planosporangium flavigriseum TaxID=373681 RepID=A0A8J3LKU3_9ACTN|nr:YggS family pyridoxal phosphate-dependent enzyme [Planosporangium flavigriseum]NJC63205.1 YggS family pyridoxal phosphate-dependent enzyme [Planosporangium flavigriseum]GIG72478.1 YggS family pyridoxal phosphate enzyme [Planosporangium flavigriseum]